MIRAALLCVVYDLAMQALRGPAWLQRLGDRWGL